MRGVARCSHTDIVKRHQATSVHEYIYIHSCMYISHQGRVGYSRDLAKCSYTYLLKRQQTTYCSGSDSNSISKSLREPRRGASVTLYSSRFANLAAVPDGIYSISKSLREPRRGALKIWSISKSPREPRRGASLSLKLMQWFSAHSRDSSC